MTFSNFQEKSIFVCFAHFSLKYVPNFEINYLEVIIIIIIMTLQVPRLAKKLKRIIISKKRLKGETVKVKTKGQLMSTLDASLIET